jgi:hypothetical protein
MMSEYVSDICQYIRKVVLFLFSILSIKFFFMLADALIINYI